MAGVYGVIEHQDQEPSQLVASEYCLHARITLKDSAGDLVRGTVMAQNTSTHAWEKFNPAGSNGTNEPRCILSEDVADSTDQETAGAYFTGKYRADDLIWPDAITTDQRLTAGTALADKGIILDESIA
ncbi:MAG: head decoration protein [Pseudomonadota bacterium]